MLASGDQTLDFCGDNIAWGGGGGKGGGGQGGGGGIGLSKLFSEDLNRYFLHFVFYAETQLYSHLHSAKSFLQYLNINTCDTILD